MTHIAARPGNTAIITGAADGIGLASACTLAGLGMNLCLVDIDGEKLSAKATEHVLPALDGDASRLLLWPMDVANRDAFAGLKTAVIERFGAVHWLMNNAGIPGGGESWNNFDRWRQVLDVNLWGAINAVSEFAETMIAQDCASVIINTGSKQGITCPPGDTPYNISKSALKTFTEQLQHTLRNTKDCKVTAHLLVPGFTYSGMVSQWLDEKPDSAWWPQQVVDFMLESLAQGHFYILCPDNDVTPEMDAQRIRWSADDIIEQRPPLSRWHEDYDELYKAHEKKTR